MTALSCASAKGNAFLVKAMLKNGAGIDSTTYSFLSTMTANVHVLRLEFISSFSLSIVGDVGSRTYK